MIYTHVLNRGRPWRTEPDRRAVVGFASAAYATDSQTHKQPGALPRTAQPVEAKEDTGFLVDSADCLSSFRWSDNVPSTRTVGRLYDQRLRQRNSQLPRFQ